MSARRRLDAELVRRGLAASRGVARTLIEDGRVTVGGAPAGKAARLVAPDEPVVVAGDPPRYVSRAGGKLEGALSRFGIDPNGRRALDVGASTGGFTDCLLQHGAAHVTAVDVGTNQLHERLRRDPRVTSLEQTDIRSLEPGSVPGPVSMATVDVSFIGLARVVRPALALAEPDADLVALVKPQFEAGRREADRGRGVIRDPQVWRRILGEVDDAIAAAGPVIMDVMVAAVPGASGNVEFVVHARRGADRIDPAGLDAVVAEARDRTT